MPPFNFTIPLRGFNQKLPQHFMVFQNNIAICQILNFTSTPITEFKHIIAQSITHIILKRYFHINKWNLLQKSLFLAWFSNHWPCFTISRRLDKQNSVCPLLIPVSYLSLIYLPFRLITFIQIMMNQFRFKYLQWLNKILKICKLLKSRFYP